jgi:hypothetical protein
MTPLERVVVSVIARSLACVALSLYGRWQWQRLANSRHIRLDAAYRASVAVTRHTMVCCGGTLRSAHRTRRCAMA